MKSAPAAAAADFAQLAMKPFNPIQYCIISP
jgi:hypothetical protein